MRASRVDWRVWFGLTLTALYLGGAAWHLGHDVGWAQVQSQSLDSLGNFLEGAFAPLAFLWLVIGYFLQYHTLMENNHNIGLQYIEIVAGTGAQPTDLDQVEVWYTGWLQDTGTKFDSSVDRGTPSTFAISGVVSGFAEGLKGMKEGGQRRLIIPPELAYGEAGSGSSVPPNSTLIFDVELIRVIPGATAAPTAAPTPAP